MLLTNKYRQTFNLKKSKRRTLRRRRLSLIDLKDLELMWPIGATIMFILRVYSSSINLHSIKLMVQRLENPLSTKKMQKSALDRFYWRK